MQFQENTSWTLVHGFSVNTDFCLWTLERDGLHVPPFVLHKDGNKVLQQQGLTPDQWLSWFNDCLLMPEQDPLALWKGNQSLHAYLQQEWTQYLQIVEKRRQWEEPLSRLWSRDDSSFWHDLQPYTFLLSSLSVSFINYVAELEYPVPPTHAVVTIVDGFLDLQSFRTHILHIAETLSEPTQRKYLQSKKNFHNKVMALPDGEALVGKIESLQEKIVFVDIDGHQVQLPLSIVTTVLPEPLYIGQEIRFSIRHKSASQVSFSLTA